MEVPVEVGAHEVGVRLRANFGTAVLEVEVVEGTITTITCERLMQPETKFCIPATTGD